MAANGNILWRQWVEIPRRMGMVTCAFNSRVPEAETGREGQIDSRPASETHLQSKAKQNRPEIPRRKVTAWESLTVLMKGRAHGQTCKSQKG